MGSECHRNAATVGTLPRAPLGAYSASLTPGWIWCCFATGRRGRRQGKETKEGIKEGKRNGESWGKGETRKWGN